MAREVEPRQPAVFTRAVTRRTVLKGMGGGAAVAFVRYGLPPRSRLLTGRLASSIGGTPTLVVDVLRPEDFLRLRFRLVNFLLDTSVPNQPVLSRASQSVDALVIVELAPQAVVEQALWEGTDPIPSANDGVDARLAGRSRLAFTVPANVQTIPFRLDTLLDWTTFAPRLVPVAQKPHLVFTPPKIRRPHAHETALEAPWWLLLSPGPDQAWAHATEPVTRNGRTELWHTRLASLVNGTVEEAHPDGLRAVWARDPAFADYLKGSAKPPGPVDQLASPPFPPKDGMPFRMAYSPRDRLDAVRNTSDFSAYNPAIFPSGYLPQPFRTDRLMLSALGAWLDIDGSWPDSPFNSLAEWRDRATFGRDHYVRTVHKGYLYPFGHRAVLVIVGERKLLNGTGTRGAYLTLRTFIVVTQPVRTYPASFGLPHEGRGFPFSRLEVVTRVSPDFNGTTQVGDPDAFQPLDKNGNPITLTFEGTDWEGNTATFPAPFVFVDAKSDAPFDATKIQNVNAAYAALPAVQRSADLGGQRVAFATPSNPGNTALPVGQLVFGALDAVTNATNDAYRFADQLRAFPTMLEGLVHLPTVEQLAGAAGLAPVVSFVDEYLQHGFDPLQNKGEAFLAFAQSQALKFATENAGGLANPNTALSAVTRTFGPIAGQLQDVVNDRFDPQQVFQDLTAKVLGGIPLKDILDAINDAKSQAEKVLKYVEDHLPDELVVRFSWKPDVKADPLHVFQPRATDPKTEAFLEGEAHQSVKDPNKRSARFHGEITNFRLNLIGDGATLFLRIDVAKVAFTSASGQKTQVDVKVDDVAFDGALRFVNELRKYLPAVGDGLDSVRIPTAIVASMGFAIPTVAVGVFELSNLSFHASVTVPLTGDPVRVRFGFSSRHDPFTLTIDCFGGGGWFAIALGADGMEQLEIGFDFCGSVALDVGVAEGGVDIMAGTYLKIAKTNAGDNVTLEGFLKMHGQVEVLGIISVSLELYLAFQYMHKAGPPERNIVTGRAKCTLKVEILFFTISVSVDVEKSFGGDPNDPTFAQAISANDWADYAAAFASV